jgi:hypothetical protein
MSRGLTSLHKILKEETRRQIILLLNGKGSLTYTELKDSLEVVSTGLLNYHLKVLGDLLAKDEEEKYVLTEKGKLASRLLLEFPEDNNIRNKPTWWRKFWIAEAIVTPIYLAINIALYFRGYIDATTLYNLTLGVFACIGIGYMITHLKKRRSLSTRLAKAQPSTLPAFRTTHMRIPHLGRLNSCHERDRRKFLAQRNHRRRRPRNNNYDSLLHRRLLTGRLDRQKNKLLHPTLPIKTMCNLTPDYFSRNLA